MSTLSYFINLQQGPYPLQKRLRAKDQVRGRGSFPEVTYLWPGFCGLFILLYPETSIFACAVRYLYPDLWSPSCQWQLGTHVRLMIVKLYGVYFENSKCFSEVWIENRAAELVTSCPASSFIGQHPALPLLSQSGDFGPSLFPTVGPCQSPRIFICACNWIVFAKESPKKWHPCWFPGF